MALGASALGAPKDAVGLSKISLPKGPGSIEGLGDSFEPQLNSGTSAYQVKIAVPPGVNGLQPEVSLAYNSGSGNGPFGIAWGWTPMSIQRQTEKGLPVYGAGDVFTFMGEELVRLDDGSYRVENESGFYHLQRTGDGWLVRDRNGNRYHLGVSPGARISQPRGTGFDGAFKWYLEEVVDTHGNRMTYGYVAFPDSPGQLYCEEIRYSIQRADPEVFHSVEFRYEARRDVFSSYLSGFEIRTGRRCRGIEVRSQGALVRRYQLDYELPAGDPIEPVSLADAGLDFSLIRRVTQFDRAEPGQATSPTNYLPPLQFGYSRFDVANGTRSRVTGNPPYSLSNPNLAFADINGDSLPDLLYTEPLTGGHSVFYNLGQGRFGPETAFVFAPWNVTLDVPETQLADFDGDGRVDLVQKHGLEGDRFVYFPNTTRAVDNDDGRPAWGSEQSFAPPFPPFTLDDPSVRSLDLDGDKRMDYLRTTASGLVYFFNRTNRWEQDGLWLWGEPRLGDLSAADGIQFDEISLDGIPAPNRLVKLADFNGDRLLDLAKLTYTGDQLEIIWWPNQGRGAWGHREIVAGTLDLTGIPLEDVFVEDINGDGLADVVAVDYDQLRFWINQGNGRFSAEFRRTGMPEYRRGETVLRQADLNGNGSTDWVWENFDRATGKYVMEFYDFLGNGRPNLLQTIDNGIGLRTHIAYRTTTDEAVTAREAGHPWHTRLPFPTTVVASITRELGLDLDGAPGPDHYETELSYYDGYYDGFEKEFRGFAFAKKVERGDERYPAIELSSPATVTRLRFHTGAPDGMDNNQDGDVDEFSPIGGYEEESLKGRVLWTETTLLTADVGGTLPALRDGWPAEDSVVFTRDLNEWRIKTIHSPTNGFRYVDAFGVENAALSLPFQTTDKRRVNFAFLAAQSHEIHEANGALHDTDALMPPAAPRRIFTEHTFDFYGNAVVEQRHGVFPDTAEFDDERFSYDTYAINPDAWLIGLPARNLTTDENGVFVAESRSYYDGAPFAGLPLGQVGSLGDLTRQEALVNSETPPTDFSVITTAVGDPREPAGRTLTLARNRYDEFGNLTVTRDALWESEGRGHEKEYAYDSVFHTYVEQETIRVGNGSADLVARATYDRGAGVMTGFTDFNGNSTTFQYDSFWRLVGIVKPGDSAEFPTAAFEYQPGDPFRGLYYNYDATGNLTLVNTAGLNVVNSVTTHQREIAGEAGTFDTVSFTDGAGHKLGTLHEDSVPGRWVGKDFKRYSSKGEERKAFLPFLTAASTYAVPPETQTHVASFYDAVSRVVRTVNPPESDQANAAVTQTRSIYLPLETQLFDEEDLNPDSPYYNTPHLQLNDGLGRLIGVIEVTKLNDDGTPAATTNHWLTAYEYDLNDNLTHITDSQGNQKWFRYDGLKRKLFMNDPDRGVMEYAYDDASNLSFTLDAKAQRITYTYDGVNRLKTEKYHDGLPLPPWRSSRGDETLSNSVRGGENDQSLLTSPPTDPSRRRGDEAQNFSVLYHYDMPDPNVAVGDGTTATARNTKGMLAWVEDLSGEEHTSYDARGRVENVIKRLPDPLVPHPSSLASYRTQFGYDSLDRVTTLTYPDSDQVGYRYNTRNLLERITGGPSGSIISNIAYRASDQLARINYGNGVVTTYDYDPRLRLSSLVTGHSSLAAEYIHFQYDFDGVSNIRQITDARSASAVPAGDPRRNTQLFQYDDLYRITRAQYTFALPGAADATNGFITYRYDRIGNMLNQSSDLVHNDRGVSVTDLGAMNYGGSAGPRNRLGRTTPEPGPHALTSISSPSALSPRHFPYDPNGNMTVIDGLTNTWDFKDRLIAVESAEMRAEYTYDYTDRRVMKQVWPKATNAPSPLASRPSSVLYPDKYFEVREHDAPVKYVWNGNTRVARVTGSLTTNLRTQRLRLWPGWNLISVAVNLVGDDVRRLHLSDPSLLTSAATIASTLRWNPATLSWLPIAANGPLPAGTVLWLHANTNTTLSLNGTYADPTNQALAAGVNFLGGWGLQPLVLSNALPADVAAWNYDAAPERWLRRLPGDLLPQSDAPLFLAPGIALMARAEAASTLTVPENTLQVRYYHQDHLGSSSVLTDAAGALVSESANYAFGFARNEFLRRSLREPYQFTGKEKEAESLLANLEARYLASTVNRFLNWDPGLDEIDGEYVSPQRLHAYSYCINQPSIHLDPDGKHPLLFLLAVGLGLVSTPDFGNAPTSADTPTFKVTPAEQFIGITLSVSFAPGQIGRTAAHSVLAQTGADKVVRAAATSAARSKGISLVNKVTGTVATASKAGAAAIKSAGFKAVNKAAPKVGALAEYGAKRAADATAKAALGAGAKKALGDASEPSRVEGEPTSLPKSGAAKN